MKMKSLPAGRTEGCYFGCKNEGHLFKFPSNQTTLDKFRFIKWKAVLYPADQKQDNEYIENNFKLCHRHFSSRLIVEGVLSSTAIPSIDSGISVLQIEPPKENVSTSLQNVDSINVVQNVDLSINNENINTEVVWLPESSTRTNLDLPTPVLEDENVSSSIFSDDESTVLSSHSDDEENVERSHSIVKNKGDRIFTVSKMEFFKEWVKHSDATGFEQDRRLFNYISTKLDLNSEIEPQEYIKNIISFNSFQLCQMWLKCGRDQYVMYKKYAEWFNSPPIKFTISAPVKSQPLHKLVLFCGGNPPQNKTQHKLQSRTNQAKLLRMNLEKNGDVFMFLKKSMPPFRPNLLFTILTSIAQNLNHENKMKLKQFCNRYVSDLKFKWLTANYDETVFKTKFDYWLQLTVRWPAILKTILNSKAIKTNIVETAPKTTEHPASNPLKCDITTLEEALTNKFSQINHQDISKVMHRLVHHPEDAVRMKALIANSECTCSQKPVLSDSCQSPEKDPDSIGHALSVDVLGTDSFLSRDRSPLRYKPPSEAHRTALKQTLDKLKAVTTHRANNLHQIELNQTELHQTQLQQTELNQTELQQSKLNQTQLQQTELNQTELQQTELNQTEMQQTELNQTEMQQTELNQTELQQTELQQTELQQTELNQTEKSQETELRPVVEKIIFIKKANIKSGTIVKMPNNKEGTVMNVSNVRNVTVILPKSSIKSRATVHAPLANKSDVRMPNFNSGNDVKAPSKKSRVLSNAFLSQIKSRPAVQKLLADIESGTFVSQSIKSGATTHVIPSIKTKSLNSKTS